MNPRTRNILIGITLLILVGVAIWTYAFNDGNIEVNTGLNDYKIFVDEQVTLCNNDPCIIKTKSTIHQIRFEKESFNSITSTAYVKRGETTPIDLEPKKTIVLTPSDIVKDIERPKLPAPPNFDSKYSAIAYSWNEKRDKYLFLDKEDNRLKIIDKDGEITLITILKNIESPINFYWSSDEKRILINKDKDFYFIDVVLGSRKKYTMDFEPAYVSWSPKNDYVLLNDKDSSLYKINWNKQNYIEPLNTKLNLLLSAWVNDNQLLIYKANEKINKTNIFLYNPLTTSMEQLTQKFDFPVDDIYYDQEINTAFMHDSGENKWYKLEL